MIFTLCWGVLAAIHLMPALALARPQMITTLYGVEAGDASFVLLHHRAALFLGIVIICLWAAWRPEVRPLASVVTAISMLSFLWLFAAAGQPSTLRAIALADLVGLPCLAVAAWPALRAAIS